jgi:flagellar protein FliJ
MKACSRETALRSKRFEVTEKGRKVAEMESMIADFERVANDLMRQIAAEEERTGIKDRGHCSYSTFASAARLRRDNLLKSAEDLKVALYTARREHESTAAELKQLNPEVINVTLPVQPQCAARQFIGAPLQTLNHCIGEDRPQGTVQMRRQVPERAEFQEAAEVRIPGSVRGAGR